MIIIMTTVMTMIMMTVVIIMTTEMMLLQHHRQHLCNEPLVTKPSHQSVEHSSGFLIYWVLTRLLFKDGVQSFWGIDRRITISSDQIYHHNRGGGGGGKKKKKIQNIFLINFLAKSGNSKHFSFFSFFSKKNNCGHYFCLLSTKTVDTLFPAISITHQGCACT